MSKIQEELPPDFRAWLKIWQQAERDAWTCLARYRTTPTPLTHIAIDAAWSALEVARGILESWLISHPGAPVAFAISDAQLCRNDLLAEIKRSGLLKSWGKELPRH
jgi:hypothetical protein